MNFLQQRLRIVVVGGEEVEELIRVITNCVQSHPYFLTVAGSVADLVPHHRHDLIITHVPEPENGAAVLLRQIRDVHPSTPIVLLGGSDEVQAQLRDPRFGAVRTVAHTTELKQEIAGIAEFAASIKESEADTELGELLTGTAEYLSHHPALVSGKPAHVQAGVAPLCQQQPQKFLELSRTYSNLLTLAVPLTALPGTWPSDHIVSRKIAVLASDLGSLHAGVHDVIDMHDNALLHAPHRIPDRENRRLLLEVMSGLATYYDQRYSHSG